MLSVCITVQTQINHFRKSAYLLCERPWNEVTGRTLATGHCGLDGVFRYLALQTHLITM